MCRALKHFFLLFIFYLFVRFRGEIYNTTTYPLSADDVYYICRLLHERQSYYKEILWLEEFTKQIDNGCYKGKTTPARAYKALAGAYFAVCYHIKIQALTDSSFAEFSAHRCILF